MIYLIYLILYKVKHNEDKYLKIFMKHHNIRYMFLIL